jgi:hypothetical protein
VPRTDRVVAVIAHIVVVNHIVTVIWDVDALFRGLEGLFIHRPAVVVITEIVILGKCR